MVFSRCFSQTFFGSRAFSSGRKVEKFENFILMVGLIKFMLYFIGFVRNFTNHEGLFIRSKKFLILRNTIYCTILSAVFSENFNTEK